jgi:hypothetical protein
MEGWKKKKGMGEKNGLEMVPGICGVGDEMGFSTLREFS